MAATIEVNYFNSFWLKKVVKNGDTDPSWPGLPWNPYGAFSVAISGANTGYGSGSATDVATTTVTGTGGGLVVDTTAVAGAITAVTIVNPGTNIVSGNTFTVNGGGNNCTLTLTTKPFPFGSGGSSGTPKSGTQNYYVEEARIKGGFNNSIVDLGVRAYAVNDNRDKINRSHSLIFSGVYNIRTGFNETNVFSVGEAIMKDAEPINGSIQKLYSEDTNLIIFQENKVSKALISKTTVYSGEQGANESLGLPTFIGQLVPYLGEYGISKNPESFAIFGYRKYFIDRNRAAVLRLSRDGITEISAYGMRDYFRDYLATIDNEYKPTTVYKDLATGAGGPYSSVSVTSDSCCDIEVGAQISLYNSTTEVTTSTTSIVTKVTDAGATCTVEVSPSVTVAANDDEIIFITYRKDKALGGYDIHNQNYVVSLQTTPANISTDASTFTTVSFDEGASGWTSFYTYKPNQLDSLKNKFYTFYKNTIYEHYDNTTPNNRGKFYGATTPAETSITFIFNPNPTVVKNFNTVAYEGGNGWEVNSFKSDFEGIDPDVPFTNPLAYNAGNQYQDTTNSVKSYEEGKYTTNGVTYRAGFNRKENKYVANLISSSVARPGEIIFGSQVSGIKGYIATVKVSTDTNTDSGGMKELFSVSSNFVLSSY